MGNILCRERNSPRRVYVKPSSVRSGSSFYDQTISPNSFSSPSNSKTETPKIFHSTPNLTSDKMNSTITLDPRIFDNGLNKTPVAPPRKKRSTLKKGATLPTTSSTFADDKLIKNGFKDVFINGNDSRVLVDEVQLKSTANTLPDQKSSSFERKLKVGNRKSDKILGESLSDHLSDEPVVAKSPPTAIENDDQSDETDKTMSTDKKLFFLMNMLEHSHEMEDQFYKDKIPVEEPLCVAKKKVIKHICDDDEHMHNTHFHDHEKESQIDPPKKPERDFSKYQKSEGEENYSNEDHHHHHHHEEVASENVKKSLSRENLPTPPEVPVQRKSGANNFISTPIIRIDSSPEGIEQQHEKSNEKVVAEKVVENETSHKKSPKYQRPPSLNLSKSHDEDYAIGRDNAPQTAPILTHEIVDQMMKKPYGLHDYHPEDFTMHNVDDGSNLVAPTSKLTVRKVSVGRKISSGSSSASIDMNASTEQLATGEISPNSPITPMVNGSSMNDIIEEIYSKNSKIMKEFQSYLEASVKSPTSIVDDQAEKSGGSGEAVVTKKENNEGEKEDQENYSDSFESSDDDDQQTVKEIERIRNKFPKYHSARRESIEDVDNWFNRHLDIDDKKSNYENTTELPKAPSTTYDTQKTFPFGATIRERSESVSDDFFSDLPIFNHDGNDSIVEEETTNGKDITTKVSEVIDQTKAKINENTEFIMNEREKSPDHSTLLKLLHHDEK